MFEWLQNAFVSLIETVQNIGDFIISEVKGIAQILLHIPTIVSQLTALIGQMPPYLEIFAIVTFSICILYVILGRDNGSGG